MTKRASKRVATKSKSGLDASNYGELTRSLRTRMTSRAPVSYDRGRERMSKHLEEALKCTPTRARHIVSSLVQKGYVRFGPHPNFQNDRTIGRWTFHPKKT